MSNRYIHTSGRIRTTYLPRHQREARRRRR
jgi:hypothetical protein